MASHQITTATLVGVRAGHHPETTPKYDRVVFEFNGPIPLMQISYVKQLLGDGSGLPVPINGHVIVQVQLTPAKAHSDTGQPTAPGRVGANLPDVKEIVSAGDFEGVVNYGIGLDRKADMRIITLANPSRIVIDFLG